MQFSIIIQLYLLKFINYVTMSHIFIFYKKNNVCKFFQCVFIVQKI
jgi:hypothetical protein